MYLLLSQNNHPLVVDFVMLLIILKRGVLLLEVKSIKILEEIHDKKINFLIGSGASYGALKTLSTNYTKDGKKIWFEDIVSALQNEDKRDIARLMFCEQYCKDIIKSSYEMKYKEYDDVFKNYVRFLEYIIFVLSSKKINDIKRCNIFTTNYDLFIEHAANQLIEEKKNFIFNDGSSGFFKKYLRASNFNKQVKDVGIFDNFISEIPMINFIKMHGSVSWKKDNDSICVDYKADFPLELPELSEKYLDGPNTYDDLSKLVIADEDIKKLKDFWNEYKKIPIVNPTKWKFYETVFEQHYYQMLRLLSYELEKKDVYLITFGFSFKDEHIYDLVLRSLLNPELTVIIFCYNDESLEDMKKKFSGYKNVFLVYKHKEDDENSVENLDFSDFNDIISGKEKEGIWKVMQ